MILNIDVSKQWGWVSALALPAFAATADDSSKILSPFQAYQVSSREMTKYVTHFFNWQVVERFEDAILSTIFSLRFPTFFYHPRTSSNRNVEVLAAVASTVVSLNVYLACSRHLAAIWKNSDSP